MLIALHHPFHGWIRNWPQFPTAWLLDLLYNINKYVKNRNNDEKHIPMQFTMLHDRGTKLLVQWCQVLVLRCNRSLRWWCRCYVRTFIMQIWNFITKEVLPIYSDQILYLCQCHFISNASYNTPAVPHILHSLVIGPHLVMWWQSSNLFCFRCN